MIHQAFFSLLEISLGFAAGSAGASVLAFCVAAVNLPSGFLSRSHPRCRLFFYKTFESNKLISG